MNAEAWRRVPGYGGVYEISDMGNVRSWRWRGTVRAKEPHLLTPYLRKGGTGSSGRKLFVKLTDEKGVGRERTVLGLMVETWMGGKRPGKVPYHKNGDLTDNWVGNIAFASRRELGRKTGAKATRIPVVKVTPDGEIVAASCKGEPHELSDGAGSVQREGEKALCAGRAHLPIREVRMWTSKSFTMT